MSMPMPRLSEKKVCPRALTSTAGVILLKSGLRKYSSPTPASGRVSVTQHSASNITNSTGISTLLKRSMPFCTPHISTPMFRAIMPYVASKGVRSVQM